VEEREFSTGFATGEAAGEEEERFVAQKTGDGAAACGLGQAAFWNLRLAV